jgi:Acetyltransferase (GNAT) domain
MTDLAKPPAISAGRKAQGGKAASRTAASPAPSQSGLLFHEPWWLAAVTQGHYEEVKVTSGDQVVGRLPFVITRKMGFATLRMPPFTHLLGPVVDAGLGKPQTQLLKRMSIVRDLIDQLPRFDHFKQALSASTVDGLAFQDRGFEITPQYTFRIDCRRDPQQIWQDMHFKTRQHIRRAEEKFRVSTVEDACRFTHFYDANVRKQGMTNHIDFGPFGTVLSESQMRDSGEILCASWPDGTPTAMVFLVWGHGTMYYLMSTRASDAGDNGSVNLLLWTAVQRAHARSLMLDLDGVSSSGTARFLSRFGGSLEMRLIVRRSRFLYSALQTTKRRLVGGQADETTAFT